MSRVGFLFVVSPSFDWYTRVWRHTFVSFNLRFRAHTLGWIFCFLVPGGRGGPIAIGVVVRASRPIKISGSRSPQSPIRGPVRNGIRNNNAVGPVFAVQGRVGKYNAIERRRLKIKHRPNVTGLQWSTVKKRTPIDGSNRYVFYVFDSRAPKKEW